MRIFGKDLPQWIVAAMAVSILTSLALSVSILEPRLNAMYWNLAIIVGSLLVLAPIILLTILSVQSVTPFVPKEQFDGSIEWPIAISVFTTGIVIIALASGEPVFNAIKALLAVGPMMVVLILPGALQLGFTAGWFKLQFFTENKWPWIRRLLLALMLASILFGVHSCVNFTI